jgi:predicted nuclease of predicted toxin-antitoxin system
VKADTTLFIFERRDWGRLPDTEILEKAMQEERVVLTFDLDFGDLLAIGGQNFPSVVIFRLRNETPSFVTAKLVDVLSRRGQILAEGAIVIVEDARHRIRRLPIEETGNL